MYFRFRSPTPALHLFSAMPHPTHASWNTAISGCVKNALYQQSLSLFSQMRLTGPRPNTFVLASVITACTRMRHKPTQLHSFALKLGMLADVYVSTALLNMYGRGAEARRLFGEMPERNVVTWTSVMVSGSPREALEAYAEMRREGVVCNHHCFSAVVSSCGLVEDERAGLQVVGHVVVSGFEMEVSVANAMISLFGNLGRMEDAVRLFRRMEETDTVSWNSIISLYSREGMCEECLKFFSEMRFANMECDATTMSSLISACASADFLKWGRGIHGLVVKQGLDSFVSVSNTLVNIYSFSGSCEDSEFLFHGIKEKDRISWNTMISSYVQSGKYVDALKLFAQMIQTRKETDHVTFAGALAACSNFEALMHGKMVHAFIIHFGLQENLVVGNALITMYGKCNAMKEAEKTFRIMSDRNLVTWNALIGGHVDNEEQEQAMQAFNRMREAGKRANYITMINLLAAFYAPQDLMGAKSLHGHLISTGLDSDEFVTNSLLTMYAKCGDLDSSGFIFDCLPSKTAVSWNAMIASRCHQGHGEDALKLFMEMRYAGREPDEITFCRGFAAAAGLASLQEGQQLHALVIKNGYDSGLYVINAAMDMYAKCGEMDDLLKVVPEPCDRLRESWNIMISGYARYGCFKEAEATFREMLQVGPQPDHVTFISLLAACNHGGLIDKGLHYYDSMSSEFGIMPRVEHCVCIVDLLGRSGRLTEAERFIENMPVLPNAVIWRSLLGSSRTHRNVKMATKAAQRLIELDPSDDAAYVLLSNAYATDRRWEDVEKLREHMELINLKKKPACSWIKVKNNVSTFGIGERSHPDTKHIYAKLEEILQMIRKAGYVADTSFVLHDTDDEQKEHHLWKHGEKLALAYGLIGLPEGSTIKVFKNIRVCGDCHLVYKLVSSVFGREIVLRDPFRFHHFKGGECSCSDYW